MKDLFININEKRMLRMYSLLCNLSESCYLMLVNEEGFEYPQIECLKTYSYKAVKKNNYKS